MSTFIFKGMPSIDAQSLRNGNCDAHGNRPETAISDGAGIPCRHCLSMIKKGIPYLIASYMPFSKKQPYAEQGPILLHAEKCEPHLDDGKTPDMFESSQYILRGYDKDERTIYGTGQIVPRENIHSIAKAILENQSVNFLHIRSATNNCWQGRIERSE